MTEVFVASESLSNLGINFTISADEVKSASSQVNNNLWGAGTHNGEPEAGRAYKENGTNLNEAISRVGSWLGQWSSATSSTGSALGDSAFEWYETDSQKAGEIEATGDNNV